MRRLFRWVVRLVLGLIVLIVVAAVVMLLLLDTLAKEVIVNRLRSRTGMDAKVGSVHVGLLSPTLSIENVKLYNTADFGGSLCLDMPELHLQYDTSALRGGRLHLTLLRLNIAELSLVVDKRNRMNFDTLKRKTNESNDHKTSVEKLKFTGIDVMNVTLGKFHTTNLASGRSEEMDFGIKNRVLRNVKTGGDLSPLGVAAFSRPKPNSPGNTDVDLGQVIEELLKSP
jgi:uncharacterized protein involved in outer membrane biogenesis